MLRNLKYIRDDELDQLNEALGVFDPGEGVLTMKDFKEVFIKNKKYLAFNVAVRAYKWLVKNNFEI